MAGPHNFEGLFGDIRPGFKVQVSLEVLVFKVLSLEKGSKP